MPDGRARRRHARVDRTIHVPRAARLVVSGVTADVTIRDLIGGIESDFGGPVRRSRSPLPSAELAFRTGDGDGRVSIETLQGRIRVRSAR